LAVTISAALLGAGRVGIKAAAALVRHPEFELLGVCEPDEERRERIRERIGVDTYETFGALLDRTSPSFVQVATPPRTHYDLAMQVLEAGADVYVEKVMTLDGDHATDLIETAELEGRKVYVRRNSLYTPAFRRLYREATEIGDIRRVSFVNSTNTYDEYSAYKQQWLRDLPGGIVSEHLPHALYVTRHLMGAEPETIEADFDGKTLDVRLGAANVEGAITYLPPGNVAKNVLVAGTEGMLLLNEDSRQLKRLTTTSVPGRRGRVAADNLRDISSAVAQATSLATSHLLKHLRNAIGSDRGQIERNTHFRQLSEIAGQPEHDISGREGLKNVRVFEDVWSKASLETLAPDSQASTDS